MVGSRLAVARITMGLVTQPAQDGCFLAAWEMRDWQPWPKAGRVPVRGCPCWWRVAAPVVDTTLPFTAAVCTTAQSHKELEAPHSCGRGELCTTHPLCVKLLSEYSFLIHEPIGWFPFVWSF